MPWNLTLEAIFSTVKEFLNFYFLVFIFSSSPECKKVFFWLCHKFASIITWSYKLCFLALKESWWGVIFAFALPNSINISSTILCQFSFSKTYKTQHFSSKVKNPYYLVIYDHLGKIALEAIFSTVKEFLNFYFLALSFPLALSAKRVFLALS